LFRITCDDDGGGDDGDGDDDAGLPQTDWRVKRLTRPWRSAR